jgi:hypothetical protein
MGKLIKMLLVLYVMTLVEGLSLFSQLEPPRKKILPAKQDSLLVHPSSQDTSRLFNQKDTTRIVDTLHTQAIDTTISRSSIDDIIKFKATDSVRFEVNRKHLYMRGQSKVEYKKQKLEAEIIEFFFDSSLLTSQGAKNAEGKSFGFPSFTDNNETYFGEKINYNFRTKQGTISLGETQIAEGYYFGSKIKRISEDEFFVQEGRYTTCNAPHPHFFFGSPKMKVIPGDRVFLDPLIFYVEDIPVFVVPLGLYFPNKTGRQSGLIVPSFFFSQTRGVTIQNLGLYLALSDYYDTRFSLDFFSKGGFLVKNYTQWKYRNELNGSFDVSFGRVRLSTDEPYQKSWGFNLQHNHRINPFENFSASLRLSSQDFFRQTSTDLLVRQTQDMTSNASYTRAFENGSSMAIAYSRSQNIITQEYTETPTISYTIPQINPFSFLSGTFLKDISFQYSMNASYQKSKQLRITNLNDTSFAFNHVSKVSHSPSISLQLPKWSYFSVTPFFSFSVNNYFRRLTKTMEPADSSIRESIEKGFFAEYRYSLGVNFSTKLYGIVKPNIFGIRALRHTISPSIQYSYTPNLSNPKFGFYGKYYDYKQSREIVYSRFEKDGGGLAPTSLYQQISYSLSNQFSAKIFTSDTSEDKTLDFFNATFSGSYNFAADSLRFSDISVSLYTPSIPGVTLNANLGLTLYDQDPSSDARGNVSYHKVNRFLIEAGKGLFRLTNFSLNFSTSFGGGQIPQGQTTQQKPSDSLSLGERFALRRNYEDEQCDFWGEQTPGYQPFSIRWNCNLDLNYNYNNQQLNVRTHSLLATISFSLNPTQTWAIRVSGQYDIINRELLSPVININKDLHCWDLTFIWYPIGLNRGFYFRFGIKSSILRDLKIERRSSPIY